MRPETTSPLVADLSSTTLRLCSAIDHFIRNNCLYFVCYGWSAQALTVLTTLPNSIAW